MLFTLTIITNLNYYYFSFLFSYFIILTALDTLTYLLELHFF